MFKSLIIAFSMYSKIPMPHVEWKREDMRYALAFFPLVGAVIGAVEYLCFMVGGKQLMGLSGVLRTAIAVSIPIIISGGIHLDGYMDTSDALSSYRSSEERLRILKDPHIGAFAVIRAAVLIILYAGAIYEVFERSSIRGDGQAFCVLCLSFILSRIMSGLSVMLIKPAGNGGTLETFSGASARRPVVYMLCIELAIVVAVMMVFSWAYGLLMAGASLAMILIYRAMALNTFGGVTGDTSGWFLCMTECLYAVCLAMAVHL